MTSRRLLTPVAKTLLDAADYIAKHGHCKGKLYTYIAIPRAACAMGAIYLVGAHGVKHQAMSALAAYLNNGRDIAGWNDHPDRTAAEVIYGLRQAAIAAAHMTAESAAKRAELTSGQREQG